MSSKKSKDRLYAIAKEAIKQKGSCSTSELSDYIVSKNGKNVKWLPQRATISAWMRANPSFYLDGNKSWRTTQ